MNWTIDQLFRRKDTERRVLGDNNFTLLDNWKVRMQADQTGFIDTAARWLFRGDIPETLKVLAEKFGGKLEGHLSHEGNFYQILDQDLKKYEKKGGVIPLDLVIFEILKDKYPKNAVWEWQDIELVNVLAILSNPREVVEFLKEKDRHLMREKKERRAWNSTARAYYQHLYNR